MRRFGTKTVAAIGCVTLLAASGAGLALAQSPTIFAGTVQETTKGPGVQSGEQEGIMERIPVWGTVISNENGSITINNQSEYSSQGDMILHIGEDTRVLEGENGFPTPVEDIKTGDTIYAYIGPVMTMSLPPQTSADMIICNVPAGMKAPEQVKVKTMEWQENEDWVLTSTDDVVYNIPKDCPIIPFLTRNMVTLQDVTENRTLLLWSDGENTAQKMVLFAQDMTEAN